MAFQIGQITCVGHMGQVYYYSKEKEPIGFYFLFLLYLVGSLLTTVCMIDVLFL